ncbi:MAG: hypothetical protein JW891_11935 [Candidatus Lokiarchaeota archaeon]|nr:hypothetical protein [Candidatus Lokiarchaeota archaeon]
MAPYSDNEVVITTTCYASEGLEGETMLVASDLFQPSPKFSDSKYPAIVACHGNYKNMGRESMNQWCVELAKRGFVVLSIDLPRHWLPIDGIDTIPRSDLEPKIVKNAINHLKGMSFVNGSAIGVMGIGSGATTSLLSAGTLSEVVKATISMNGVANFTQWLIEGIFPSNCINFTINENLIMLHDVNGIEITREMIQEVLEMDHFFNGNNNYFQDLFVEGTTSLNRSFLDKFDAVNYLSDVNNNSVLLIESSQDLTYYPTNQSREAYDAISFAGKFSSHLSLKDDHFLQKDLEHSAYYCVINYFEEKLKGIDLGTEWPNDAQKYSQKRDITLIFAKNSLSTLFLECIIVFFVSLLPLFIIVSILIYNKNISTKRVQIVKKEEIDEEKNNFPIEGLLGGKGSYLKTIGLLLTLYSISFLTILGVNYGIASDLIVGTMCAIYYLVFFLTLYFIPDKAEISLWNKNGFYESNKIAREGNTSGKKMIAIILLILLFVSITSLIGASIISSIKWQGNPLELIFTSILLIGCIFIASIFIILIFFWKKQRVEDDQQSSFWNTFGLDKYNLIRSFTFGSVIYLSLLLQWNLWSYFLKFPFRISPQSIYFVFVLISVALYFGSIEIIVKVLKESYLKPLLERKFLTKNRAKQIIVPILEFLSFLLGLAIQLLVVSIAFSFLLNQILFERVFGVAIATFILTYISSYIVKLVSVEKRVLGIPIFVPIIIFSVIGFLFHI